MEPDKNSSGKNNDHFTSHDNLTVMDKMISTLALRGMASGNDGDFNTAFLNMELALWMTQHLNKKCLEAVLLNNLGLLYTMQGAWDKAMLTFDCAMEIAFEFCTSNDNFLSTLNKNISCLFDPKITTPKDPDNH
jgi:lipopolysaccharide biosynthesis glycosyltransferase